MLQISKPIDVVFVHPNASNIIYQSLSASLSAIEPPIWAAMLAQRARRDGFNPYILDCEAEQIGCKEASNIILNRLKPRLTVIVVYGQQPSASTQNMVGAELLSKQLYNDSRSQEYIPNILFVGAHPSALPERTALDNPWAFVCKGEGPDTVKAFLQGKPVTDIPGLWYITESSSTLVLHNEPAPLIKDLDKDLPGMAWDLLPMEKYRTSNWHSWTNRSQRQPFASIYTSLGCPFDCQFCMINTPFGGSSFRYWSPEFTIEQLRILHRAGIKNIKFADEMFVLQQRHFMKICELIIKEGFDFNIWAYARIDTVKEQYLSTLRDAGVKWLALGIEAANINVRQEVAKGSFQDVKINDIVNKIQAYDIEVIANYIFGLPGDTLTTMQETLDLALELNTSFANFYSTMAYPGSYLHREASANHPEYLPENAGVGWAGYSQHSIDTYNLPSSTLSNKEILRFRDEAFIKYFTNPKYIEKMISKFSRSFLDEMNAMLSHKIKRKLLS